MISPCLCIIYIVVCLCSSQIPNLFLPFFLLNQKFVCYVWVYFGFYTNISFIFYFTLLWLLTGDWLYLLSSVTRLCPTLCDPMNCSTPGLPVHHQLPEITQTHVHQVGDAIQPSHPLSSPSPPAPNPSHHQGLFQWVSSSHEVAKVLEFQLQDQSFQWTPKTELF